MRLLLITAAALLLAAPAAQARTGPILVTATLIHASDNPLGPVGRVEDTTEQKFQVNDRNGRPVGRWLLACRWIASRNRLCVGELKMPLGKITMVGSSFTALAGRYAVTGGTDLYDHAGGAMQFTSIGNGKLVLAVQLT